MKIKKIRSKKYKGLVYNLGLEGNSQIENSYYANGILASNCRSVWLPITRDEIDDPRFLETDLTMKNNKPVTVQEVTRQLGTSIDQKTFCDHN